VRILVVEDHAETRRMLERALKEAGHTPDPAADLEGARGKAAAGGYGAIILDWMLPDGSGIDLCRELRASRDTTPVLILTARGEVDDRVRGLDAGADDYLRKPFSVAEMLARLRALLRRGPRLETETVVVGPIEVRLSERRVLREGREVPLTGREFSILEVLLRRRGHVVSRSDILEAVWGEDTESAGASLEVLMGRLRKKLTPGATEALIETQRGFGYLLRSAE